MSSNLNDEVDIHTCYICQLQVPLAAKTRHEGSYLHQLALKIASTALGRLRAHIARISSVAEPVEKSQEKDRDTSPVSFCGACAAVFPSSDSKHIRTKTHLMAALDDQVFDELVRGYVGEEERQFLEVSKDPSDDEDLRTVDVDEATDTYTCCMCALDIPKTFKTEHDHSSRHRASVALANTASQRTIAFLTPTGNKVDNKTPTKNLEDKMVALLKAYTGVDIKKQEHIETEEETEVKDVKDNEPSEVRKRLTPKQYFKDIMPFVQYIGGFYTLIIDDTDYVTIKTENGTYIRVHIANFNGLYNIGGTKDYQMKCKMCDGYFVNASYSSKGDMDRLHVMSLGHIKNVLTPIKSIHGIREIDNTHSLCVLCNAFIHTHNVEDHTMRDIQHTAHLAEALEKGKLFKESEKDIKFMIYNSPPVVKTGFMNNPPPNFNSVLHPHWKGGLFRQDTGQCATFGQSSGQTGSLFGAAQPSAFGKTEPKDSRQNQAFGQSNQSTLYGGFGQSNQQTHLNTAKPVSSVFGNSGSSPQSSGTGLGRTNQQTYLNTAMPASTAFGNFPQSSGRGFGLPNQQIDLNSAKPASSVFGNSGSVAQTSGTVFGQSQSQTGLFGKVQSQTFGNSGFGKSDKQTASFGSVPFGQNNAQTDKETI